MRKTILTIVGLGFCVLLFDALPSVLPIHTVASHLLSPHDPYGLIGKIGLVGTALLFRFVLLLAASYLAARTLVAAASHLWRTAAKWLNAKAR